MQVKKQVTEHEAWLAETIGVAPDKLVRFRRRRVTVVAGIIAAALAGCQTRIGAVHDQGGKDPVYCAEVRAGLSTCRDARGVVYACKTVGDAECASVATIQSVWAPPAAEVSK